MSRKDYDHRYNTSDKGKARGKRYSVSAKGLAREARYAHSAKGKNRKARNNAKVLRAGDTYVGYERNGLTRQQIQDHIDRRLREFKQGLKSRAQAKSDATGAVPTETSLRAD